MAVEINYRLILGILMIKSGSCFVAKKKIIMDEWFHNDTILIWKYFDF
jgi:hypothetical protein